MDNAVIGKLVVVESGRIIVEMADSLGTCLMTEDGPRFAGEPGTYVVILGQGRRIAGEITAVEGQDRDGQQIRQARLNLLGEFQGNRFSFGLSRMPLIFSEVLLMADAEVAVMLDLEKHTGEAQSAALTQTRHLAVGAAAAFPGSDVTIDVDKFFGFHFAIFGNTGSGKSNTLASILQRIFSKSSYSAKGAKFVILDSNGEYGNAFSQLHAVNPDIMVRELAATEDKTAPNHLEIPVWALSADDWAILLNASERTQIPILQRAIEIARTFFARGSQSKDMRNHILASALMGILNSSDTSPSKKDKIVAVLTGFYTEEINLMTRISGNYTIRNALTVSYGEMKEMDRLLEYLKDFIQPDKASQALSSHKTVRYTMQQFYDALTFAALYEGSLSSQGIQEYTAPLITRLQGLRDGIQGNIFTQTLCFSVEEYVLRLLGENQIVNIDMSMLDDLSAEVVAKVLSKLLLDYLKNREDRAQMPVNLLIEEAHRYIKDDDGGVLGYNIFERIAKEGRKFGFLMGISSQRPSELSKTVVSQCHNFIIHRVQNPDDLHYISQMVPYISQDIMDRLTYLPTGQALVFGTAVNLPMLAQFSQADPPTDSANAKISELWYRP